MRTHLLCNGSRELPRRALSAFIEHAAFFCKQRLGASLLLGKGVSRIALVIAENESPYDVSVGDLIARIPMIHYLSSVFPDATIHVLLKPYHFSLKLLPELPNVTYRMTKGNTAFREIEYFRKTHRDMFSREDLAGTDWDLVVDSSSRDGWKIMRGILEQIGPSQIRAFVPCNMLTSVWFADVFGHTPDCNFLGFSTAYELFVHRLFFHLKGETFGIAHQISPPKTAQSERYVLGRRRTACLIVDKSPVKAKMWSGAVENPFDSVAAILQQVGWDVFVHRFEGPDESLLPQYELSQPTFLEHGFDDLVTFFNNERPVLVLGIDTGVMHFLSATITDQWIAEIFVNQHQNPFVWAPRGADVYLSFCNESWNDIFPFAVPGALAYELLRKSRSLL